MVNAFVISSTLLISLGIVYYFNVKNIKLPYMVIKYNFIIIQDEEFHLRQTISYYSLDFSFWEHKLTTFPGLFLFSAIVMKIIFIFVPANPLKFLRLLNVGLGLSLDYILDYFLPFNSLENTNLLKLLIIYLPINYFYNFLFYTDTLSIILIIYYFYLNIHKQDKYKTENKKFYFFIGNFFYKFIRIPCCISKTKQYHLDKFISFIPCNRKIYICPFYI